MKTKPSGKYLAGILTALAATVLCGTARADLSFTNSPTVATWNQQNGQNPFYSTSLSSLTADGLPTAGSGATNEVLSETFTITNGAGSLVVGTTNYLVTGISFISSAGSSGIRVHLYDITTNLTSNNGTPLQGSGASYTITSGDLLGGGGGLFYSNNLVSEQQVNLSLSTGPNTDDQIVLGTNHTYALEFSVPVVGGSFTWYKGSTADPGGQAMGSGDGSLAKPRITITSLGQAGGAPRTFAVALYGAATSAPFTVNNNTNTAPQQNYVIDDFSTNGVSSANPTNYDFYNSSTNVYSAGLLTNVWANWFGDANTMTSWDPTVDAQGNTNSGSLKIGLVYTGTDQLEVWDQGPANNGFAANVNGLIYSNFECDVLFDTNSATVTNGGVVSYGALQFGCRTSSYGQDYFGNSAVVVIPQGTTNWTHVKLPLNPIGNSNETTIAGGILIHIYAPFYTGSPLIGSNGFWVDNIKFTGSSAPAVIPPPKLTVRPALPGLRIFAGSLANTYDREELNTVDSNQSWTAGTYPVTYSFTLLSTANFGGFQTHIFLVPVNTAGNSFMNNEYIEYQASNNLWLQINGSPSGQVTANVSWKTNYPNANPNTIVTNATIITNIAGGMTNYTTNFNVLGNVALNITNSTGVGTWTLEFDSATTGKLTAPGAAPASFTIADPNAAADFGNPLVAFFGLQANSGAGGGAWEDYANITVSNVTGFNENDHFANDTGIDPTVWNINNSAAQSSLVVVPTGSPFWISWTLPDIGFALTAAPALTNSPAAPNPGIPFALPGYYSDYNFGNQPPGLAQQGPLKWVLLNTNFLPTIDYINGSSGPSGTISPTGYFQLINPAPSN